MERIILLIGVIFVLCGGTVTWYKDMNRTHFNNKAFNNRIKELKEIITDKDITYEARIEELTYMRNTLF